MSKFVVPNFRTAEANYRADAKVRSHAKAVELLPAVAATLNLPVDPNRPMDPNDLHAAGTAVAVATPAYTKWLAAVQERNPLIGRKRTDKDGNVIGDMFEAAPEYEADDEQTKASEPMPQETVDQIGQFKKDADGINRYHINDDYEPYMPTDFDPKLDGAAANLSELYVIQNAVEKRIGFDFKDVMDGVMDDLKEFHIDDLDFEMPAEEDLKAKVQKAIGVAETRLRLTDQSKRNAEPEAPAEPAKAPETVDDICRRIAGKSKQVSEKLESSSDGK